MTWDIFTDLPKPFNASLLQFRPWHQGNVPRLESQWIGSFRTSGGSWFVFHRKLVEKEDRHTKEQPDVEVFRYSGYFILGCGSQVQEISQEISELSLSFPCNFPPSFFLPWPGATAWSRASCCGWPLDVTGGFKSLRCWISWSLYRILGIIKQP